MEPIKELSDGNYFTGLELPVHPTVVRKLNEIIRRLNELAKQCER